MKRACFEFLYVIEFETRKSVELKYHGSENVEAPPIRWTEDLIRLAGCVWLKTVVS